MGEKKGRGEEMGREGGDFKGVPSTLEKKSRGDYFKRGGGKTEEPNKKKKQERGKPGWSWKGKGKPFGKKALYDF